MSGERERATAILAELSSGQGDEGRSAAELMPLVYAELRVLAEHYLRGERPGHTLQATALVHEAYLRLIDREDQSWQGRTHFLAVGARAMRNLLIDHARARGRLKRGGGLMRVTLAEPIAAGPGSALEPEELLALDRALEGLAELDERAARVVELRFFAGLKVAEVAELLGVSKRTVEEDWVHARTWLKREMAR